MNPPVHHTTGSIIIDHALFNFVLAIFKPSVKI